MNIATYRRSLNKPHSSTFSIIVHLLSAFRQLSRQKFLSRFLLHLLQQPTGPSRILQRLTSHSPTYTEAEKMKSPTLPTYGFLSGIAYGRQRFPIVLATEPFSSENVLKDQI